MSYPLDAIQEFAKPFYANKDIMHDWSHIERVAYSLNELAKTTRISYDKELIEMALCFHGIIYSHEEQIRQFLKSLALSTELIESVIEIAWESQKEHKPQTPEGLLLHDAHMLEGGRNFEIIKSLITGSIRGQNLQETMLYIEQHLLNKGSCYTDEGKRRYEMMKNRTRELFEELNIDLGNEIGRKK